MFQLPNTKLVILSVFLLALTAHADTFTSIAANKAVAPKPQKHKPALQHAKIYTPKIDINLYWVSEKLDGVRGYWNGQYLVTRNGNKILVPKWFTHQWPKTAMDGELWIARNTFDQVSGCIRRKKQNNNCWKSIKFMVFDLPYHKGTFSQRIKVIQKLVKTSLSPYLAAVTQYNLKTNQQLMSLLDRTVNNDGEGLMLHLASATYQSGRSSNILKLKRHQDAEAIVIGHNPGKGKYQGLLGSILVEMPSGIQFKIGTGFSDALRKKPPAIGSTITYKYIGKTQRGVPRFASFMRIKSPH